MYIIEYSPPLPREGEMKSKVLEMGKKIKGEGKKKEKKERQGRGKRRGESIKFLCELGLPHFTNVAVFVGVAGPNRQSSPPRSQYCW